MRLSAVALVLALAVSVSAVPNVVGHHHHHDEELNTDHPSTSPPSIPFPPAGGHEHGHLPPGISPLLKLNESEVLLHHAPDPLSYWAHDIGMRLGPDGVSIVPSSKDESSKSHGFLMAIHVVCMTMSFFAILPIGIMLRVAKHPYHSLVQGVFLILVFVGWLCTTIYTSLTPDLYPGESHSSLGYILLLTVVGISAYDFLGVISRLCTFIRHLGVSSPIASFKRFWTRAASSPSHPYDEVSLNGATSEYVSFREGFDEDHRRLEDNEVEHLGGMAEEPERYTSSSLPTPFEVEVELHDVDFMKDHHQSAESTKPSYHSYSRKPKLGYMRHGHLNSCSMERGRESTSSTLRDEPISPTFSSERLHHHSHHRRPHFYHSNSYDSSTPSSFSDGEIPDLIEEPIAESRMRRAAEMTVYIAEWVLVFFGYVELVTGGVVYSGICRATYANGCLAHLTKGSIFFLYGVLTFCRYLGAFARYGWAWNRVPTIGDPSTSSFNLPSLHLPTPSNAITVIHPSYPSAEFIECFVIFLYGITNTWLERQGAHYGDPFSTRQIQHISIAVMYWFGGGLGLALESGVVKKCLGAGLGRAAYSSLSIGSNEGKEEGLKEPDSYSGSFNPFPALIIGITGIAMSAHAQTYLYAVQVHTLWGYLLLSFSIMRCLTYIFLWLKPPTVKGRRGSVLPSRPPTEAIGSLCLAAGGLVFVCSTEQIEFAAMRSGHDDIMMILNLVISVVCIVFCWCLLTLAIKGWAKNDAWKRNEKREVALEIEGGHDRDIEN